MDRHDVKIKIVPEPLTPLEQLVKLLEGQVRAGEALRIQGGLLHSFWSQISGVVEEHKALSKGPAVYEPVRVLAQ